MKYVHLFYYKNSPFGVSNIDNELSSTKELTGIEAERLINYLENYCNLKRHDTKSTFFYCIEIDSRHSTEHIFFK